MTDTTSSQRSAVDMYRQMAPNYLDTDYFERNRARLGATVRDRSAGRFVSADEIRNRLIIEAFAQACESARSTGEPIPAAIERAAAELNDIVSLHANDSGAELTQSGYSQANSDRLMSALEVASRGERMMPSQLREALERVFIEEACRAATEKERDIRQMRIPGAGARTAEQSTGMGNSSGEMPLARRRQDPPFVLR